MNNDNIYNQLHEIESNIPKFILTVGLKQYIDISRKQKSARVNSPSCLDDILSHKNKTDDNRFCRVIGFSKDHVRNSINTNQNVRNELESLVKRLIYCR